MSNRLVITHYNDKLLYAYIEDDMLTELSTEGSVSVLGNVYVGLVTNIVKNLNAAFVLYDDNNMCFYSLDNHHIFLNNKNTDKVCEGDYVLVQIEKEGRGDKKAVATSNITLKSENLILDLTGKIGISSKITEISKVEEYKTFFKNKLTNTNYGLIVRTSAVNITLEALSTELDELITKMEHLLQTARHSVCKKMIYSESVVIKHILEYGNDRIDKIITDIPNVYNDIIDSEYTFSKVELYEDDTISLMSLYNLNKEIGNVLSKKVWLKSGGFLIIEQTEAMVVIDVNSGKAIDKKNREENILKVNLEAATEIARQLRLRNLSGIIIIDFINMNYADNMNRLIEQVKIDISKDKIKTNFIEMTKLNLVELTRKKVRLSFEEQVKK